VSKRQDWAKVGEVVEKIRELGLSFKEGAERYGLKPWVVYEYNRARNREARAAENAAKNGGAKAADGAEERPAAVPGEVHALKAAGSAAKDGGAEAADGARERPVALPGDVRELIAGYRREHPAHGFKRIQDLLKGKYLVVVSRKQIRRVLKDAGLLKSCDSSFDREEAPAKGTRRFEAERPGDLWQMDVAYVYIRKIPVLYLVVIVDDHSRYCVAAELCRDQRSETLIAVLEAAIEIHGRPKKLLTDQGSGFYSWSGEQTRFQEYLDDAKIEHIVAEPQSPTTQGKVERLIQTIREELLSRVKFTGYGDAATRIRAYIESYNAERTHQGIQGHRPADRFYGVVGEVEQAESQLGGPSVDLSRGYAVYKVREHRVSVVWAAESLQVYLDGRLLVEADGNGSQR
jgi:transposase InsO family protein